jgi:16S rRNA U516 pseudouridylate synthase RsuA-like enzyme
MLAVIGYTVRYLTRIGVGSLTVKGVAEGRWRHLTAVEVQALKQEFVQ